MRPKFALTPESGSYSYPNAFMLQKTSGPDRLLIAPSSGQIATFGSLLQVLPEPFGILYVLLVPRGESVEPGRYASPAPSGRSEVEDFMLKFQDYLESDSRHHLWVISLPRSDTLVYDNHNIIYAYGPLKQFKQVLLQRGILERDVTIPYPHTHGYNVENDPLEREIMHYWAWRYSPLLSADDDS